MNNYKNDYNRVCDQLKWLSDKINNVKSLDELKSEVQKKTRKQEKED